MPSYIKIFCKKYIVIFVTGVLYVYIYTKGQLPHEHKSHSHTIDRGSRPHELLGGVFPFTREQAERNKP